MPVITLCANAESVLVSGLQGYSESGKCSHSEDGWSATLIAADPEPLNRRPRAASLALRLQVSVCSLILVDGRSSVSTTTTRRRLYVPRNRMCWDAAGSVSAVQQAWSSGMEGSGVWAIIDDSIFTSNTTAEIKAG